MTTYKISYFIPNSEHPGGIINLDYRPQQGKVMDIGGKRYRVQEVIELMPPQGDFQYLHVTCTMVENTQ